jgi:hypothetical protein
MKNIKSILKQLKPVPKNGMALVTKKIVDGATAIKLAKKKIKK